VIIIANSLVNSGDDAMKSAQVQARPSDAVDEYSAAREVQQQKHP
jgi:hypothetical protein